MAEVAEIADRYRLIELALATSTTDSAIRWWNAVDIRDDMSWRQIGPQIVRTIALGQRSAALAADPYLDALGVAQGAAVGELRVVPDRLAGVASDGRSLEGLVQQSLILAQRQMAQGRSPAAAHAAGRVHLTVISRTQVADAARVAAQVATVARPWATRYVRVVGAGACSRCVVLAGKVFYRYNPFERHPGCLCMTVPMAGKHAVAPFAQPTDIMTDPMVYFDSLTEADQDRIFTKAGAEAIRLGADMSRVVNSRSGMTAAGTTTVRVGRRRGPQQVRLMPEEIIRQAAGSTSHTLRLLAQNGYLVDIPMSTAA